MDINIVIIISGVLGGVLGLVAGEIWFQLENKAC